jgi:hypothetical protein
MFRTRSTSVLLVLVLGGCALSAQTYVHPPVPERTVPTLEKPTTQVFRGPREELPFHPFLLGDLVLTLTIRHLFGGADQVDVRVDNPTQVALAFDPDGLCVVDATGRQTPITRWCLVGEQLANALQPRVSILPGAHVSDSYLLDPTQHLKGPARVYLGGQLLAELAN